MEDRHTVVDNLCPTSRQGGKLADSMRRTFVGVYDGHNGSGAAEAAAARSASPCCRVPPVAAQPSATAACQCKEADVSQQGARIPACRDTVDWSDHGHARAKSPGNPPPKAQGSADAHMDCSPHPVCSAGCTPCWQASQPCAAVRRARLLCWGMLCT